MAENQIVIEAPPERVFAVLADPFTYSSWVGGAQVVHDADAEWPAPGSALKHESGVGPVTVVDRTEVLDSEPPRRLLLRAQLGPLGAVRVELILERRGEATHVTMLEEPVDGVSAKLHNPVGDLAMRARNAYSLRRLKEIAETG